MLAEEKADLTQERFLQIYIKIQKAIIKSLSGDYIESYKLLDQAKSLRNSNNPDMEFYLIELEYAGIKIIENLAHEIIPSLEKICEYFKAGGHKVQFEKAHLYLALSYISTNQPGKVIENLLHVFSSLDSEYPSASLIATSSKFKNILLSYSPAFMQTEFNQFMKKIKILTILYQNLEEKYEKCKSIPIFTTQNIYTVVWQNGSEKTKYIDLFFRLADTSSERSILYVIGTP